MFGRVSFFQGREWGGARVLFRRTNVNSKFWNRWRSVCFWKWIFFLFVDGIIGIFCVCELLGGWVIRDRAIKV